MTSIRGRMRRQDLRIKCKPVMENRSRCSGTYRARWGWGMLKCPPLSYTHKLPNGIAPAGRVVVEDWQDGDFVLQIGGPIDEAKDAKSASFPRKQVRLIALSGT